MNIRELLSGPQASVQASETTPPPMIPVMAGLTADDLWRGLPADMKTFVGGNAVVYANGKSYGLNAMTPEVIAELWAKHTKAGQELVAEQARIQAKQDTAQAVMSDAAYCADGVIVSGGLVAAYKTATGSVVAFGDAEAKTLVTFEMTSDAPTLLEVVGSKTAPVSVQDFVALHIQAGLKAGWDKIGATVKVAEDFRAEVCAALQGLTVAAAKPYAIPEMKEMPAVVELVKPTKDGKIYQAKSVSPQTLKDNAKKFKLAQWCRDQKEATQMAKELEERRADVKPLEQPPVPEPERDGKGVEESKDQNGVKTRRAKTEYDTVTEVKLEAGKADADYRVYATVVADLADIEVEEPEAVVEEAAPAQPGEAETA